MLTMSEPRRPRLLPQNRKLRHLKSLSLRNLCFAPANWQTADDASLLKSPPRQPGKLHSSRSSDSLRTDKRRPRPKPRRSSLSLVPASPLTRQRKLEELVDNSVADVFFSIHVADGENPVYVSEVRHRSANFNFQFFDLSEISRNECRYCIFTIRIWSKRPQQARWIFLLEELIDLRQLNFIGTLYNRIFPPNALIFHLEDGLYSLDFPARTADPKPAAPTVTSSYNALMKLANLESSVQDALDTQHAIKQKIDEILADSPPNSTPIVTEHVRLADKLLARQKRANKAAEMRRDNLRKTITRRREAITRGRAAQAAAEEDIANNREKLATSIELSQQTERQIRGQRRRICSELSKVFPITPTPGAPPLSFQICKLPLPNSVCDAATAKTMNEDSLSAALGLVAMLSRHLQFYLSCPLPYPLIVQGSRSYAQDNISRPTEKQGQRQAFPLYLPRGGSTIGQGRFEYGWFLLNKNIATLCAAEGLRIVDIRNTLPNLEHLLYVYSAGTEEMPERKKGGVRGLWAGRVHGRTPDVTSALADVGDVSSGAVARRRGSEDSVRPGRKGDGTPHEAVVPDAGSGEGPRRADGNAGLPFAADAKFTLRTKGLRENVAK